MNAAKKAKRLQKQVETAELARLHEKQKRLEAQGEQLRKQNEILLAKLKEQEDRNEKLAEEADEMIRRGIRMLQRY
ncbi:hypothetical protein K525DRAFT_187359 [Schizophyllum commune Loenen D]|nr:hypothetical protein K525DRAFT_187359 [Schizophyllum commune Loenen D]